MKKTKVETTKIHPYAVEELACAVTGIDYDEIDADHDIIEQALADEFEISFETFHEIVERLMPMIMVGNGVLSKKNYKGFADVSKGLWLTKMEVTE